MRKNPKNLTRAELIALVEKLERQNSALMLQVAGLERQNDAMMQELGAFYSRVRGKRKGTPPSSQDPRPSDAITATLPGGNVMFRSKKPTRRTLNEYEEAIRQEPQDAELRWRYGMSLWGREVPSRASEQFRQAISLRPEWDFAHAALGHLLMEEGKFDEAVAEFREAVRLRLAPANARGASRQQEAFFRFALGQALDASGDRASALEQMEEAVALLRAEVDAGRGGENVLGQYEAKLGKYLYSRE